MEYMHGGDIYTYENVTDYSVNLNPFGPGEEVLLAMEESLKHAGEYPDSKSRKLRSALAEHLQVPQEFLIFGNGAAELIFLLTHSLRPKKALLTIPSFAEYHRALQAVDCECVYYPLSEKHGFVPQTSYLELLKEDVDLLFLCSPDNPSGAVIPKDFLLEILKTCEEKGILMILDECFVEFLSEPQKQTLSPDNPSGAVIPKDFLLEILKTCEEKGILMILDECFVEFLSEPQKQTLARECERSKNLMILQAFTKISAIPGIRLGYGITSNLDLLEKMEGNRQPWSVSGVAQAAGCAALKETKSAIPGIRLGYGITSNLDLLEKMEGNRQPWSVSGVAQAAGCAALKETKRWQEMRKWLETERAWLEENLTRIGVEWFPSKVNYLLLKSSYPLFSLLLQKNILIRDCSNYEGLEKGYYRIAVKQRTDNEKLLKALEYIYEGGE